MAKRQRNHQVTASFHYLVKSIPNDDEVGEASEEGFTEAEFNRVIARLQDTRPIDDTDDRVIAAIKLGRNLPFNYFEEPEEGLFFGNFEGAYYGQKYRNNRLGVVEADSLNLRGFHYLVTRLRDGKILIGTTYHGAFGDYEGLKNCFSYILAGNYRIASKTLTNASSEIGTGRPISVKLIYRKRGDRAERRPIFGSSGVLAVTSAEYGDNFEQSVSDITEQVRGTVDQRKRALARIVSQSELLSLDEDEIIGCSAVIREEGGQRTIYLLGDNNFSTKFGISAEIDGDGIADPIQVRDEMIRVMREKIIPMLA
ncbi:hypothetical protein C8J47_2697 [Sphingomonas sp. PP-F2F-G114-C0414]|uniref:hypothetical protein n=1 Tax=Sphingomonas sp. PP-F2F-G114-C0414 TaxID=2135662 RepID=UPI000F19B0FD|nr:hypothetical protein [Sphingomonas sp. PP-F2F-G114-C0414]RMB28477.1 hypothetical protein C8J47_2697 [Sphingomonas sp. PP-F2F-G114-C0414]